MSPHDDVPVHAVAVEIAWCPGCRADCTMEVVELAGDPGPVAVCVDCGLGLELWYSPGVPVPGAIETVRPVIARAS